MTKKCPNSNSAGGGEGSAAETPLAEASPSATELAGEGTGAVAEQSIPEKWDVGDVILETCEVTGIHHGGAMGDVYRVHHREWDMEMALKRPNAQALALAGGKENFVRECHTWMDLGLHPHIVTCHYVRVLGGVPLVFAEYVEGGSLKDWIEEGKLTDLGQILDVAIQFAWGLEYAHSKGLVHQDVKPANVLMTLEGVAKVSDFGLARARPISGAGKDQVIGGDKSILVTKGGMTPAYCSPEQAAGEKLSRATDIYSWAVSIFEIFTGEVTWPSGTGVAPCCALISSADASWGTPLSVLVEAVMALPARLWGSAPPPAGTGPRHEDSPVTDMGGGPRFEACQADRGGRAQGRDRHGEVLNEAQRKPRRHRRRAGPGSSPPSHGTADNLTVRGPGGS